MSDEAPRRAQVRTALPPPERRGGAAASQGAAIWHIACMVGGGTVDVASTTAWVGIIPAGTLHTGIFSITTEAGTPEIIGDNGAGAATDAYPPTGAIDSTHQRAFAVVGRDGASDARTSDADTTDLAENVVWVYVVHGHAVESRGRIGAVDAGDIVPPVNDRTFTGPGSMLLAPVAACYDQGSPPNPYATSPCGGGVGVGW